MDTSPENIAQNPYQACADMLRPVLADPEINYFEHEINWPRFKALLPRTHRIRSVLDFGCGPGNFTQELAGIYPRARIIGADVSDAMLPEQRQSSDGRVRFIQWDGYVPQKFKEKQKLLDHLGTFDLIVAKLSMHYMQDDFSNIYGWWHLINHKGSVAFSVPHPEASGARLASPHLDARKGTVYETEIGNTGVQGTMVHRTTSEWIAHVKGIHALAYHRTVVDEPGSHGVKKRLNLLFCPSNTNINAIASRIARCEGRDNRLLFRDRALGSLGLSRLTVARNSQGKATSDGCTGWLIKDGQVLAGQKEAEYSWLI